LSLAYTLHYIGEINLNLNGKVAIVTGAGAGWGGRAMSVENRKSSAVSFIPVAGLMQALAVAVAATLAGFGGLKDPLALPQRFRHTQMGGIWWPCSGTGFPAGGRCCGEKGISAHLQRIMAGG
jgi:hypothetical protein